MTDHQANPMAPAVLRMPTKTGEFMACWPQDATADELKLMRGFFEACMDGWIASAVRWESKEEA